MKLKPMKHYPKPFFPTKNLIQNHPEILNLVPKRWQNSTLMIILTFTMTILSSGLKQASAESLSYWLKGIKYISNGYGSSSPYDLDYLERFNDMTVYSKAQNIIEDELRKADIEVTDSFHLRPKLRRLTPISPQINHVFAPNVLSKPINYNLNTILNFPYALDGIDSTHQVVYEYITLEDAKRWGFNSPGEASEVLSFQLSKDNSLYHYALFTETDEETLRFQVQCFIEWLKVQGVI